MSVIGVPEVITSIIPSLAEFDDIWAFEPVFYGFSSGSGFDILPNLRVSVMISDIGVPLDGFAVFVSDTLLFEVPVTALRVPIMASDTG